VDYLSETGNVTTCAKFSACIYHLTGYNYDKMYPVFPLFFPDIPVSEKNLIV